MDDDPKETRNGILKPPASAVSSPIVPMPQSPGLGLRNLRNHIPSADVDSTADELARSRGIHVPEEVAQPQTRKKVICRLDSDIDIPFEDEKIEFDMNLRADFPYYAMRQLDVYSSRYKCTRLSILLQMMASFRGPDGKPVFTIRESDLVPDRRNTELSASKHRRRGRGRH